VGTRCAALARGRSAEPRATLATGGLALMKRWFTVPGPVWLWLVVCEG